MANVVDKEALPSLDYLKNRFSKRSYDSRIKSTEYEYYHPVSGVKSNKCLRLVILHTVGNRVPNLEKLILALDLKITNKAKNGRPPLDIPAAPCNNFINSTIGALTISYNNKVVCKIENYAVYNYTRMMLNCDDNDFKTWAETHWFYK